MDNVVSIAIRYGLESRLSKPGRVRFSGAIRIESEIHPALYVVGNGSLFLR